MTVTVEVVRYGQHSAEVWHAGWLGGTPWCVREVGGDGPTTFYRDRSAALEAARVLVESRSHLEETDEP